MYSVLQRAPWTSWLGFQSDMHCELLEPQVWAFQSHVQSTKFATGGLQTSSRNIARQSKQTGCTWAQSWLPSAGFTLYHLLRSIRQNSIPDDMFFKSDCMMKKVTTFCYTGCRVKRHRCVALQPESMHLVPFVTGVNKLDEQNVCMLIN